MAGGAWQPVYDTLAAADSTAPLDGANLERLAVAAYMLGRAEEHDAARERQYHVLVDEGRPLDAARAAFWLGMNLLMAGRPGQGMAWLGRAGKLVDAHPDDCAERGLLLLPLAMRRDHEGDLQAAAALAAQARAVGERFADADLIALATYAHGQMLIRGGDIDGGRQRLDEAMLPVATGEVSPVARGIVYCGVILSCQEAFDLRRAREWTDALASWCDGQPDMVAFTGRCLVHRAEIRQREGAWDQALADARAAEQRAALGHNRAAVAEAAYLRGELHRLQGRAGAAEAAYRDAAAHGREPQPGLALLRAAQGDAETGAAAIQRALAEAQEPARRASLLPAAVEVHLLAGDAPAAEAACAELEAIAAGHPSAMLAAAAAHALGAVALVSGDARAALPPLRRAVEGWLELEAPYEANRSRVLLGLACRALGDEDGARLELGTASDAFARLGATDLAQLEALAPAPAGHDLTGRELEVLRLVAAGNTNRAIAEELVLSERTVHRHVSNIFVKLRVSSRAAATAYAYEHDLV